MNNSRTSIEDLKLRVRVFGFVRLRYDCWEGEVGFVDFCFWVVFFSWVWGWVRGEFVGLVKMDRALPLTYL